MFRRAFWFTTGAAAGVWATTRVQRKVRELAPDGIALRAAGRAVAAGQRVRGFALDVRAGMAQREDELNGALGLAARPPAPGGALPPAPGAVTGPVIETRTPGTTGTTWTTGNEDH